jgi:4-amino-4-deoxy-L-arabinose transferase-like glycosyltransferase
MIKDTQIDGKFVPQARPLDKLWAFVNWLPWHLVVPAFFLGVMFLFYPFREKIQYDKDEGVNLMKAMLVDEGYRLYDDIWSDQPPMFTYMLVGLFKVMGMEVNPARLLVLVLSSILVWASFLFLRWVWGVAHAFTVVVLFFLMPTYLMLSVAVMIGLPAITFAMLALLALTRWHLTDKPIWLAFSAIAMGCSVLIKGFTAVIIPVFLIGILVGQYFHLRGAFSYKKFLIPAIIWVATFAIITTIFLLLMVGPNNLIQIFLPHLEATEDELFDNSLYTINYHLQPLLPILALSVIGALLTFVTKRWLSLYPLAWMATAYLFLLQHSPVWYHHQLLVTVPGAILAAAAIGEALRAIGNMVRQRKFILTSFLLSAVVIGWFVYVINLGTPVLFDQLRDFPVWTNIKINALPYKLSILRKMDQYAPQTHWIVTDMPLYAFRAKRPVPPNLAVFTTKRIKTGNLTDEEIVETMREYQPEEVLLTRYFLPGVVQYLDENYRLERSRYDFNLYIRKDIPQP